MAGQAGVRPALTGRPSGAKVLVLGAGVSGLVVGYELGKLGYDFRILEARDRVGGLKWTVRRGTEHTEIGGERQVCTFDEGQHVNVGPWRIPYTHTGVLNYCKELGVPLQIFLNEADALVLLLRGQRRGLAVEQARAAARGQGRHDRPHQRAARQGDRSAPARSAADRGGPAAVRRATSSRRAISIRRTARYKAFDNRGPGDPVRLRARCCNPASAAGCVRFRRATAPQRRRCSIRSAAWTSSPRASSARSAATASPSTPTCSRCTRTTRGVKVVYANTKTGQKTEVTADYVVVCMPLSVLAGVDVNLSPEMMEAGKRDDVQQQRQDGAGDEAPVLGGGRPDLRRSPLLEPAARRVLVSVERLLLEEGRAARVSTRTARSATCSTGRSRTRVEHVLTHASKVHPQIRRSSRARTRCGGGR